MNTPSNAHLQHLDRAAARESAVVTIDDAAGGGKFRHCSRTPRRGLRSASASGGRGVLGTTSREASHGQDSA